MKNKLFIFLISILFAMSLNSCDTYTYATTQDDIYVETEVDVVQSDVSFDIIIKYGKPYYRNGVLLYYLYRDIYYYPFFYNDYWYVRAYRRPFTHFDTRPYFRPHKYDYRFRPGYHTGFNKPHMHQYNYRHKLNMRHPDRHIPQRRPDIQRHNNHPNNGMRHPDIQRNNNHGVRNHPQNNHGTRNNSHRFGGRR